MIGSRGKANTYFFILAYTSLIPSRITSAFDIPVTLQQYSRILTSSSDILILVSCLFGSFDGGLPVRGDISTSFLLIGDTFSILLVTHLVNPFYANSSKKI